MRILRSFLVVKRLAISHKLYGLLPVNRVSQCIRFCVFDKMAAFQGQRILVHLQTDASTFEAAHFTQCIVDHVDSEGVNGVDIELKDNRLYISSAQSSGVKIQHPPFCPVHHLSTTEKCKLPQEVFSRGIDCGAAVILESGNGKVLLTRRSDNLRTFPGIWVPPGGHIEENETISEAGLRELKEETGLDISLEMCKGGAAQVLAVWESVFPPKLSLGQPVRHHAVIYLCVHLKEEITSDWLMSKIDPDPEEVGACAWFDIAQVKAIVAAKEGDDCVEKPSASLCPATFPAIIMDTNKKPISGLLEFGDLVKIAGVDKDQMGRVSTGTKFALEEWLSLMEIGNNVGL